MTETVSRPTRLGAPDGLPTEILHYIGGHTVPSRSGRTFATLDPVSNQPYAEVAAGDAEDIAAAVVAATAAFNDGPWPRMLPRGRARVLHAIADAIEARDEQIAEFEAWDTGLPISQARGQAHRAAENFRFFADLMVGLGEDAFRVGRSQLNYTLREPVGVAGLITPWNTPFMLESWKLAPSLAAGCTVILKPAEWTPLSASLLPEIVAEAGLPAGVLNIAAYVWTSDLRRGHRVAAEVKSGMCWLNSHNVRDLRTPCGGIKASGLGHEGGTHSIDFYTHQRVVHVAVGDLAPPRFGIPG